MQVNLNDLPEGVDVDNRVMTSTWTEGAIGYRQIATRAGNDVLGILRTASGMPPLGARVQMADSGKDVGIVADEGHVWLGAVQPEQQFLVTWGDAASVASRYLHTSLTFRSLCCRVSKL